MKIIVIRSKMLEVKNISYIVDENGTKKTILDNVSFVCHDGENLVITGHNGSGKSTLLKIIMGIIEPSSGSIIFNGQDITKLSVSDRAKLGLAYAFQQPITFKGLTVRRILEIASGKDDFNSFCDLLSKLGLCARDYLSRELDDKLSGGERKRIEIATVLARNCDYNLFDEPEAGIDIWSFDSLVDIFKKNHKTNIIVSHQSKLIEQADEILVLSAGKVQDFGKTQDILPNLNNNNYCSKLRRDNGQN